MIVSLNFNPRQTETLSKYSLDLSKGLALAALIPQYEGSVLVIIVLLAFRIGIALLFLFFALEFQKETKYDVR